jgi:hypothetical protein
MNESSIRTRFAGAAVAQKVVQSDRNNPAGKIRHPNPHRSRFNPIKVCPGHSYPGTHALEQSGYQGERYVTVSLHLGK